MLQLRFNRVSIFYIYFQPLKVLQPELQSDTGQLDPSLSKHLLKLTQKRIPTVEYLKQHRKEVTRRYKFIPMVHSILSSRLGGDGYVGITHVLPHVQVIIWVPF